MNFSQSPQQFLERRGVRETLRTPSHRHRTDNPVHRYPLTFPFPRAAISRTESGAPPPDRVETLVWPHGGPPEASESE